MAKYTFRADPDKDNRFEHTTVVIETNAVGLTEIVEAFENFLRGSGFVFNGYLDIVNNEITEGGADESD